MVFNVRPATGTIPEPASRAMLMAGFGLVAAATRRRAGLNSAVPGLGGQAARSIRSAAVAATIEWVMRSG